MRNRVSASRNQDSRCSPDKCPRSSVCGNINIWTDNDTENIELIYAAEKAIDVRSTALMRTITSIVGFVSDVLPGAPFRKSLATEFADKRSSLRSRYRRRASHRYRTRSIARWLNRLCDANCTYAEGDRNCVCGTEKCWKSIFRWTVKTEEKAMISSLNEIRLKLLSIIFFYSNFRFISFHWMIEISSIQPSSETNITFQSQ